MLELEVQWVGSQEGKMDISNAENKEQLGTHRYELKLPKDELEPRFSLLSQL